jgi:hypothetical protein
MYRYCVNLSAPSIALVLSVLLGLSSRSQCQQQNVHVQGTAMDFTGAVVPGTEVTFQGKQVTKIVTADGNGSFDADLPAGLYTMSAQNRQPQYRGGFGSYRRPLFRLTPLTSPVVNVVLAPSDTCDIVVVGKSGGPATDAETKAAEKNLCGGDELISLPSRDGIPFQLQVRYGRGTVGYVYKSEEGINHLPVLMEYNLFSLRAERVTYDPQRRTIHAEGSVLVVDSSGISRAETMTLKLEDGQAVRIP